MRKETITATDFNGVTETKDYWFNLTRADLQKLNYKVNGGFQQFVNPDGTPKEVTEADMPKLIDLLEAIIYYSYGEKSADGKTFKKNEEIADSFRYSSAYDELYIRLMSDPDAATAFINSIIPQSIMNEANNKKPIAAVESK